jgi:hypothetical protein
MTETVHVESGVNGDRSLFVNELTSSKLKKNGKHDLCEMVKTFC